MADGALPLPNVRIMAASPEDFAIIAQAMRPDERDQWKAWHAAPAYDAMACRNDMIAHGEAAWAMKDRTGQPYYVGGFSHVRTGVWECWAAGTLAGWDRYWREITRHSRRMIDDVLAHHGHRVEICSLATRTAAGEWYQRGLGLQPEGRLRRYYADGRDAICYAKIKESQS